MTGATADTATTSGTTDGAGGPSAPDGAHDAHDAHGPTAGEHAVDGFGFGVGTATDEQFVDALPKVELHVHLEGSMRPSTLLALARRHGVDDLPTDEAGLRALYAFRDFNHFLAVYRSAVRVLRDEEDFALLARETALGLAAQNVRYAEITFTPWIHTMRGVPVTEVFAGLDRGRLAARAATGIEIRWICDIPGGLPDTDIRAAAERTAQYAISDGGDSVVALGVGGMEVGVPRPQFAEVFAVARAAGLHATPHAGETTGARTIWDSIEYLGADRIGHGIRALDDPALLERLRRDGIPLEVSPTSNLCTGVVASYREHPLPRLLAAGVSASLNSDDPPMFGTTLRGEYLHALRDLGLGRAEVFGLASAAVRHSFLPAADQDALLAEQHAAVAALGGAPGSD
jgi:aminodeoxyfutalosine deaminase